MGNLLHHVLQRLHPITGLLLLTEEAIALLSICKKIVGSQVGNLTLDKRRIIHPVFLWRPIKIVQVRLIIRRGKHQECTVLAVMQVVVETPVSTHRLLAVDSSTPQMFTMTGHVHHMQILLTPVSRILVLLEYGIVYQSDGEMTVMSKNGTILQDDMSQLDDGAKVQTRSDISFFIFFVLLQNCRALMILETLVSSNRKLRSQQRFNHLLASQLRLDMKNKCCQVVFFVVFPC